MAKKGARLHLRIDSDLKEWLQAHADHKKTSMTQVAVDQLVKLREEKGDGDDKADGARGRCRHCID